MMGLHTKRFATKGFLITKVIFLWKSNIDGNPVLKYFKGLVWPIRFICRELPAEDWFQPNNVTLAGLSLLCFCWN